MFRIMFSLRLIQCIMMQKFRMFALFVKIVYCPFLYPTTQKVAGYYVIPSENFECPSVHMSVRQRFVSGL